MTRELRRFLLPSSRTKPLTRTAVERWFCKTPDAREDPDVTEWIVRFVDQDGGKSVVAVDRIIGCPHEEGIDYPAGEKCTQCSFRANRDRWSGEIMR
jgi:hypothetical protein